MVKPKRKLINFRAEPETEWQIDDLAERWRTDKTGAILRAIELAHNETGIIAGVSRSPIAAVQSTSELQAMIDAKLSKPGEKKKAREEARA